MDGRLDTCSDSEWIGDLPAYAALTAQHADIPCAILKEELVVKALVQLVIGTGTGTPEFKLYEDWIRNDVRYFVTQLLKAMTWAKHTVPHREADHHREVDQKW